MAISTVSFSNTPQANGDSFLYEDLVRDGLDYICLDVMANDLGGKAKTLYSLDDGVTADGSTATRTEIQADLLARDQDCCSAFGARIWIGQDQSDGKMKVLYNPSELLQSEAYRSLSVGEYLIDSFTYAIRLGNGTLSWTTATVRIAGVNDAPVVSSPVTLAAIAEDSGARLITQAELLAHASDIDGDGLTASNLQISAGSGSLINNGNGTWTYTPALNDDTQVSFTYTVSDGSLSVAGSATLDITPVNDAPTTTPVTLAAIAEDSGARLITQAQLLANAADVDGPALTATNLQISAGSGSLVNNGNGTWTYTPALNDDTQVSFTYTVSDGSLTASGSATLDITPVNDAPTTTPVTLTAIAEDSGARLITQAQLLSNAADVDGPALTAVNLQISAGSGSLVDNGNGTWSYTPALNDDTQVSFTYTVSDGSLSAAGTASLDITPVNDAPTTSAVTLDAIAEDSGARLITQAQLLANAADVDGPALTATNLQISAGSGTLIDNGNGTWSYTPALNDDTAVSFSYSVTDGLLSAAGTASLDITPVNDAPTTSEVTLATIAEDSGVREITQAELLANADDIEGDELTAVDLAIASGNGSLVDNLDGTWTYTPALNDDSEVSFSYTISDGDLTVAGSASLDITPVNDAPTTSEVTLAAIAEDSGVRVITQSELLANAEDIEGDTLTASGLTISSGGGTLTDNGDGTWNYASDENDDSEVSFSYTISDGDLTVAGSASLDITPVNDAPTTTPVNLVAIAEDSGVRVITQAELLANADDIEGDELTASGLTISSGGGTLTDNGDGSWSYTPDENDDTAVSFSYTISDGDLTVAGSASLDITPVNDAPTTAPVTLASIAEDSGARLITQAQLLGNAADVDNPALTATNLQISAGSGSLVDNGDGTWSYTPAQNDDTSVSFSYSVTDGLLSAVGSASLEITPVNDAPTTAPVTLASIAEDSGARLITQAQLLGNAADVDSPALTANNLQISAGSGSLVDNGDGTWSYTPAQNDDTSVSFSYSVTDGLLSAVGSASLEITPVNDAPTTAPVTLASIAEDSGARLITQAQLLGNAADVDGPALTANNLQISAGSGSLVDNGNGTWSYTPALNDDTSVSFSYSVTDGSLSASGSASLDLTPVNDAPVNTLPGPQTTPAGAPKSISGLSIADVDAASNNLTVTLQVAHGTLSAQSIVGGASIGGLNTSTLTLNGTLAQINATLAANIGYLSAANFSGDDTLTMTTSDGAASDVDNLGIMVTATQVNAAPVAVNDVLYVSNNTAAFNTTNGTGIVFSVAALLGNDSDVDGAFLSITGLGLGAGAISDVKFVEGSNNSLITFASGNNPSAPTGTFTYTLSDNAGGTATGTVTVNLVSTNGASSVNLSGNSYQAAFLDGGSNVDALTGAAASDLFVGGNGVDTLIGGSGEDRLRGGEDNDTLDGGNGIDMLDFSDATGSLTFTLNQGSNPAAGTNGFWSTGALAGIGTDTYKNMEGVIGSRFDDNLTGSSGNDILRGGGGSDVLDGGAGSDLLDLSDATAALSLTLVQSSSNTTVDLSTVGLGFDTYKNMEGLIGSAFNDSLTGSGGADELRGGAGNDTLDGGAGNDVLYGGLGADVLIGGGGADLFRFNSLSEAEDRISDYSAAQGDKLDFSGLLGNSVLPQAIANYVKAVQVGGDISVQVDVDGNGAGATFVEVVTITGVQQVTAIFGGGDHIIPS
ncbi:tandem-95 repeat protein [Pseudomonas sp. BN414]|uniref:beta strand repeat-containing protein n=1 Tax=Pseudomonas sp. BN414 TaxID=2567888 RepID=UPI002457B188|nr:cadherin-like domain-containing protein [Pseudomonas sp. BN414]MDH4570050.1 tandem-95 repeat protein [Pseudomonas sp. BN414]